MDKEPKNWSEHPAYQEEDLEIKNEEELKEAKEMAGVTSHKEAVKRFAQKELEPGDLEKTKEAYSQFSVAYKKFKELSKRWDFTGETPSDIKEAINEADKYVDILPKVSLEGPQSVSYKKYTEIKDDQRFIKFNPCAGGRRCQDFLIMKQEYWGDDMGQNVIDEFKD